MTIKEIAKSLRTLADELDKVGDPSQDTTALLSEWFPKHTPKQRETMLKEAVAIALKRQKGAA